MAKINHLPSLIRRACCYTLAALALPTFAAIPVRWTVDTFRVKPLVYDCYHGETLDLAADMTAYGEPLNLAGKTAHLFWQTNGMAGVYWQTNASVRVSSAATNVLAAVFSGAFDPGADEVQGFIGVDGENYRAAFTLRFRPSPGFVPSALPLPTTVIDCATVSFTHPEASPFLQRGEIPATDLSPATNYTDACCRTLAAAQTNFTRTATNDLATTLRGEIAAHAPGNYATVSNAAMTAVQPAALDNYLPTSWATEESSEFAGKAAKNLPATYYEGAGWFFSDNNPLTTSSIVVSGDSSYLLIENGWYNLMAGGNWQTLPEYLLSNAMVNKALSLQMMEYGPCLEWDMTTERWGFSWPDSSIPFSPFAFVSEIPSTNGFITAETDPIWSANSNNFATALLAVAERTTESKIDAVLDYALTNLTGAAVTLASGQIGNVTLDNVTSNLTLNLDFAAATDRSGDCMLYLINGADTYLAVGPASDVTPIGYTASEAMKAGTNLVMVTRLVFDSGKSVVNVAIKEVK